MQRFHLDDTAIILIDQQVGTITWAATTPLELLRRNVIILASFAKGTEIPVVLTSSQETNIDVQSPLMPELQEILPDAYAARVPGDQPAQPRDGRRHHRRLYGRPRGQRA